MHQEGPAFKASNFETTFCPPPSPLGLDEEESGSDQDQQQETADPETDGETENGGEGANDNQDDEWKEDSSRPFRVAALISRRHGIRLQVRTEHSLFTCLMTCPRK